MILVSKFMVHRALSDKTYLSLVLLSPLIDWHIGVILVLVVSQFMPFKVIIYYHRGYF